MKQVRRIPALLLAMLMVCSLTLTSCGKKEAPAPADQVAVALFNMILKDDASTLVELFGYADEAEARKDMGLDGSLYDELADMEINGKTKKVWVPKDAAEFGNLLSTTAMGG